MQNETVLRALYPIWKLFSPSTLHTRSLWARMVRITFPS